MKKFSFILFSLLAVTVFTACNNDDAPENIQTITSAINNRVIDGDNVTFSQGTAKIEINFTKMLINFTADYKDIDGTSHTITTPEMKLSTKNSTIYTFSNSGSSGSGIESLQGYFDMATGMMWYTFDYEGCKVVSTSHLLYAYATTTVTNPDNGFHYDHQQSAYLFALDARGETCIMKIGNFIPNISGTVQAEEIQYNGLTVTPTAKGYTITADQVESSFKGYHTITDLNIQLTSDCHVIDGSFKCDDLDFTITGKLFPNI